MHYYAKNIVIIIIIIIIRTLSPLTDLLYWVLVLSQR
jgi:hypothetical protein